MSRVDLLKPEPDRRERDLLLTSLRLEDVELACGRQRAVGAGRQLDRLRELDDADVVEEELRLREVGMRGPPNGIDSVRATGEGIGRVALHVGLGEHADRAELAGLPGAVARRQDERRRDERSATAEGRRSCDVHDDEYDGGMAGPIELAVRDCTRRDDPEGEGTREDCTER